MRANRLRELFESGTPSVSAWLSIDSPYLAEVLSYAGYDAVTVDLQHGMYGLDSAVSLLQAVSAGPAVPMARCPSHDAATIGKMLDAGAYGIICPGVDTAEQATAFVSACRYPPAGQRSFGPSRGLLYGGSDYVEHADRTVLTWAMIESVVALGNLDAILATPGLDGVYVGPNDLALSLGEVPGQNKLPPRTAATVERVAAAAREAGRWAGIFCADPHVARQMIQMGYGLVTPGNDAGLMRQAAAERIAIVRGDQPTPEIQSQGGY
ncbi:MAG: aldolase/citrate lyase family protein [Actinomycetota bacterium]|nr:aldolase/citrate lyase family protein [Actinomycetota bacterium]